MDSSKLTKDLGEDLRKLREDIRQDFKAEVAHVTDPTQCGYVVRRHFDLLVMALLVFVGLFVAAAAIAIYLYTHR